MEEEKSELELRLEEPRPESKASERKAHHILNRNNNFWYSIGTFCTDSALTLFENFEINVLDRYN